MVQVKQDGHPAVAKRYTHCERRYGQDDWDVSSSASQVVSRSVSGVQTAVSARHQRRTRGPLARFDRISAAGDSGRINSVAAGQPVATVGRRPGQGPGRGTTGEAVPTR